VGTLSGGWMSVVGAVVASVGGVVVASVVGGAVAAVAGADWAAGWRPAVVAVVAVVALVAGALGAGTAVVGVVTVVLGEDVDEVLAAAMPDNTPTPAMLPAATHAVRLPIRARPASLVPGVR
jgi:hypothetical protein